MISIIVPIYNSEKWLERCIDSLINQTYADIEILLINDGSTDTGLEICRRYEAKDPRVKVIDKPNEGVSKTRNTGIDMSTGEYIQFVDSDDYIEPDMCEKMMSQIGSADLVLCGMRIWRAGRVLREPNAGDGVFDLKDSIDTYFTLRRVNLGPCNKLYKKELVKTRFKEGLSLGEDTLFVLDYMKNVKKVCAISECLYNVVLDNENSLNKKKRDGIIELITEQRKYEQAVLTEIYGDGCDLTRLYDMCLRNVHAAFLNDSKTNSGDIKKYAGDEYIRLCAEKSRPQRWDYKVFRWLLLNKNYKTASLYFKIKRLLTGAKK